MFNKDKSVEDFVAKTIRPVIEEEQRKEEDLAKPIQTWKERWFHIKEDRKMQKMLDKKKLEFSFEVKIVWDKIPELEDVWETLERGETAIALLL